MEDISQEDDPRPLTSPWPLLFAVSFASAEVGVFLAVRPVAIGGLLLFVLTLAGILRESEYVSRPSRVVGVCAIALLGLGAILIAVHRSGPPVRGHAMLITGGVALAGVPLWQWLVSHRTETDALNSDST